MNSTWLTFRKSRAFKPALWAAAAFFAYTILGFFVVPPILKWQLLKQLPAATKRTTSVQQVKMNPWTLSLTVRGLALTEPDGRPFASWDELYVNFQASSLFRRAWTFKEIRLVKPFGEVILLKDGRLNFANIMEGQTNSPATNTAAAPIPRITIFQVEITNGFFVMEDRTRRSLFRTEYRPINVRVQDFNTLPNSDAPYSFKAESDSGRSVTWAGDFSVQPIRSAGRLELTGIRLSRYQPYLEDFTRAVVTNGLADVQMDYRFRATTNGTELNITNGSLHVEQVAVLDPTTSEVVAGLKGLEVSQAEFSLSERSARVGALKVSEVSLLTRLNKEGRLNWLDLVQTQSSPSPLPATNAVNRTSPSAPPFTLSLDQFDLEKTSVRFEDLTRRTAFKTELKPIELTVKHFSTRPDSDASYSFQMATESEEKLGGEGSFSINPVRSAGTFSFAALDLKKYLPYVEDSFRGKITSGKLEGKIPYRFALATNAPLAGVTNLMVKLSDLEVLMPENEEKVTRIQEISFDGVDASLEARQARVSLFKGQGGSLLLRREQDGKINLLGLLAAAPTNTPASAPSRVELSHPESRPTESESAVALGGWVLKLDELALDDYTVRIEDQQAAKPASFLLDQVHLNVKGVSTISNAPISAGLSLRFNETASIAASGVARITPLSAQFEVGVTNLDLRVAQPYLEPFVHLNLVSGVFNTVGKLGFQTTQPNSPQFTFAGDLSVDTFTTTDLVLSKEFVRWDSFGLSGIDFGFQPGHVKVQSIKWVHPQANFIIGPDRKPNLSNILNADTAKTNAAAARPEPTPERAASATEDSFPIQVETFKLEKASFGFADESIQPRAAVGIEELSGTVRGLSSARDSMAEVDLSGKVDAQAPFVISGKVNPLASRMFVDLVLSNANTQLTPLTGYLEKYAGYPLRKGRLSTDLRYHIEGKELKAENKIQIDALTLGPRNTSPDATTLPVKLGIALLKDNNGRIELDVPVSGRLDDPQFSLGPIVLKVIVNMLVKAAASPFKLLGALVGGGEELSFVAFSPGSTNVPSGELEKLDKLSKALERRPSLNLEIEGAVDPSLDQAALAKQKLQERIKTRQLQVVNARNKNPQAAETFALPPEEYERLLRSTFLEQFGTNIAAILRTNQLATTAGQTNQAAAAKSGNVEAKRQRGFLQKIFGSNDHESEASGEKKLDKADRAALDQASPEMMESLLAQTITVSSEEYRQLMVARAKWIQDFLVQSGKVAADRLLLVTPKAVDASYRGEARVNLSLN